MCNVSLNPPSHRLCVMAENMCFYVQLFFHCHFLLLLSRESKNIQRVVLSVLCIIATLVDAHRTFFSPHETKENQKYILCFFWPKVKLNKKNFFVAFFRGVSEPFFCSYDKVEESDENISHKSLFITAQSLFHENIFLTFTKKLLRHENVRVVEYFTICDVEYCPQ